MSAATLPALDARTRTLGWYATRAAFGLAVGLAVPMLATGFAYLCYLPG